MHNYSIKKAFNNAASTYDEHCHLQQQVGMHLLKLAKIHQPHADYIIDLGCGTGLITQLISQEYHYSQFYAIDIANELLAKAKQRLAHVIIEENEFDNIHQYPFYFDLAFSNLALHWSIDFENTLKKIHAQLQKNGCLVLSIPLQGTFVELQDHLKIHDFFSFEMTQQLLQQQFKMLSCETSTITYYFDNPLDALRSIKRVGATYVNKNKSHTLNKSLLHSINHLRTLTYVVGYFILRKS